MRTQWRLATALIPICAAGWLAPAPASAATNACLETALPTLGHQHTEVTGGDPTGRYLVGSARNFEEPYPGMSSLVWVDGELHMLDTEPMLPYAGVSPTGVNRRGEIIGFRVRDSSPFYAAWVYRNGRFTTLPGLVPTDDTMPVAINSRGDIVGNAQRGVVWPANRPGTVRELIVPGHPDEHTVAYGIDDDGSVLGLLGGYPGGIPYIWPRRGAPYPLSAPPGINIEDTSVRAIRNGWVAGYGQEGVHLVGLLWNLRRHTVEKTSTDRPLARSVNRHGTVGAIGAIIHRDGHVVSLGGDAIPIVVTDHGSAAGNTEEFFGQPVTWTGC